MKVTQSNAVRALVQMSGRTLKKHLRRFGWKLLLAFQQIQCACSGNVFQILFCCCWIFPRTIKFSTFFKLQLQVTSNEHNWILSRQQILTITVHQLCNINTTQVQLQLILCNTLRCNFIPITVHIKFPHCGTNKGISYLIILLQVGRWWLHCLRSLICIITSQTN